MKKGEYKDITGLRYGRLTAIKRVGVDEKGKALWLMQCDCGKQVVRRGYSLTAKAMKSCGCLRVESGKRNRENGIVGCVEVTHGMKDSRIYETWHSMKRRCDGNHNTPKMRKYDGITYCEEWKRFEPFYEWAMAHGYNDSLTLDRIDNSKGYCPENCRWVTPKEQANNRTNNRLITYNGETHTLTEWTERIGFSRYRFQYKVEKGLTDPEALEFFIKEKSLSL